MMMSKMAIFRSWSGFFQRRVYDGFAPLTHRPPLTPRFWLYCTAAYLIPVVTQLLLPHDPNNPGLYDELIWLITLAPAM